MTEPDGINQRDLSVFEEELSEDHIRLIKRIALGWFVVLIGFGAMILLNAENRLSAIASEKGSSDLGYCRAEKVPIQSATSLGTCHIDQNRCAKEFAKPAITKSYSLSTSLVNDRTCTCQCVPN